MHEISLRTERKTQLVDITERVQSALESLRGPTSTLFLRGGTARDSKKLVPDQEVKFSVTPRNMTLGR